MYLFVPQSEDESQATSWLTHEPLEHDWFKEQSVINLSSVEELQEEFTVPALLQV